MTIPITIKTHKIIRQNQGIHNVSRLFDSLNNEIKNTKQSEIHEATVFSKCLQIWYDDDLLIEIVDEEKSEYKGVDFLLATKKQSKQWLFFQLLEYKEKYLGIRSTEEFANWVIEKKFKKGDNKIHLIVSVATATEFPLDLSILREKFANSPYASMTLSGPTKVNPESSDFQHFLVGLQKYNFKTIINLNNNSLLDATGGCPYFEGIIADISKP